VADSINDDELKRIESEEKTFMGSVTGKFALEETKLPSPMNLTLKVGAQVMFTKNDEAKRWVNGTVGKVVELKDETATVEILDGAGRSYEVGPVEWETFKYELKDEAIKPVSMGKYTQLPLMLAWAVTIHKSQGKTLDKVRIDLGSGAFDYGQVYVALSRCKAMRGISLAKPMNISDIRCDPVIKHFYQALSANAG
jgi:ATP-dependent exoDNAse (exonuclease V) alpha subunit